MATDQENNDNRKWIPDWLARQATKIRFPSGAIGKVCMMLAIVALACAGMVWTANNPVVSGIGLVLVAGIVFYALKRIFDFADKNPTAAILDGSEFVRHEEIVLAAKGVPELPKAERYQINEPENIPLLEAGSQTGLLDDPLPEDEGVENES